MTREYAREKTQSAAFYRANAGLALLIGGLAFGLYLRTLVPWVLPGDSGEFQVLAYEVGIAHTTGYPVYLLLARSFITLFPFGEIAYRVSLFSAVMAAVTVAEVYLAGWLLARNRAAACFAALGLAVGFAFWSQAVIAEVYTAGAAFLALVCVLLLIWYRGERRWALAAAGLCGGLGMGVHASIGMFAPAVVLFLLADSRRWVPFWRRRPGPGRMAPRGDCAGCGAVWRTAAAGGLAGLLLYLAAFLAVDLHAPPANIFNAAYTPSRSAWDLSSADINNPWLRIVFIGTAGQWRSAMFADPAQEMPGKLAAYIVKLPRELAPFTLAMAGLGMLVLFGCRRRLALLYGAGLLIQWVCYFNYGVGDIYVFYIPGYVLLAQLAAAGLAALLAGGERLIRPLPRRTQQVASALAVVAALVAGIAPLVGPHVDAVRAGVSPFIGEREYLVAPRTAAVGDVAARTVQALEDNAIVFTDWDWLYPYYYAAHVQQGRMELRFIETQPRSDGDGLAVSVLAFVAAAYPDHPIDFSSRVAELARAGWRLRMTRAGPTTLYRLAK